jgi:hypothetical protein
MEQLKGYGYVKDLLTHRKVYQYVAGNLAQSLKTIGFSNDFIGYLTWNLSKLDSAYINSRFGHELDKTYSKHFFQEIVPDYFEKHIFPWIHNQERVLDVG